MKTKLNLNEEKSKYMLFSKLREPFSTNLQLTKQKNYEENEMIHLGLWISKDLTWEKHISEICKKTYSKILHTRDTESLD